MATATRTRRNTTRAAKNTTEKKAPQPITNRFRGKCAECGQWVDKGEGVAAPPSAKGEKWSTHHGHIADNGSAVLGPCPKPATVKNTTTRNTNKKETTMPVRRTRKAASKPAPKVETFSAKEIASLSLVELRKLAKELGLSETMKKVGILNEMIEKGHLTEDGDDTSAPAKKTTTRKRAAAKSESESASESDEEPQEDDGEGDDDMAEALAGMLEVIRGQIESGALDEILGDIDDAISARLDAVAEANKPKRAAKKTTTPAKSRAEKLAPVTRSKSASDAPEEPEGDENGLTVGKIYNLKGKALGGARGKFTGYKDAEKTRAIVVLTKAHGERPKGAKVSVSVRTIDV